MFFLMTMYKVELRAAHHRLARCHISVSRFEQEAELKDIWTEFLDYALIHSHVLQDVLARLDKTYQAYFRRIQRAVSRKVKGSHNRRKAAQRLGKLHRTVAIQRANTLHQFTTSLAKTKSVSVIEDLHVAGMLKNHPIAQAIADGGVGEFRRQRA